MIYIRLASGVCIKIQLKLLDPIIYKLSLKNKKLK